MKRSDIQRAAVRLATPSPFNWLDRRIAAAGPYLALCLSQDEFDKALQHLGIHDRYEFVSPGSDATTHHLENQKKQPVCIVCLGGYEGRNAVAVAGLLVHEAVHVWQRYARYIGESHPGDEQEAYAIQCIAQELMADFARRME